MLYILRFLIVNTVISIISATIYYLSKHMSDDLGCSFFLAIWLFCGYITMAWLIIQHSNDNRKKKSLDNIYTGPKPIQEKHKRKPRFTMN